MSSTADVVPVNQIIIVKRNPPGEDGHHGGAWKIAFADFMTAMMAFFLVMWLTNVSDDATKKKVAQYFNPIQLNSMSPANSGLQDKATEQGTGPQKSNSKAESGKNKDEKAVSGTALGGEEQALFRDPYAVLAEIAADGGTGDKKSTDGVPNGTGLPGLNGGEAYRDPFDPTSWQLEPNASAKAEAGTPMKPSEIADDGAASHALPKTEVVTAAPAPPAAPPPAAPADQQARKDEAARIGQEIAKAAEAVSPGSAAGIEVKAGEGGVTISLADDIAGGMFQIGSAKPTRETLKLVESIGKILSERKGTISIRGHTDARPYRGTEYDNWRLSSARAQFVFYMLTRGGLDESRVTGIEGVADRDPKLPSDPEASANRRIEIFLKEPAA